MIQTTQPREGKSERNSHSCPSYAIHRKPTGREDKNITTVVDVESREEKDPRFIGKSLFFWEDEKQEGKKRKDEYSAVPSTAT